MLNDFTSKHEAQMYDDFRTVETTTKLLYTGKWVASGIVNGATLQYNMSILTYFSSNNLYRCRDISGLQFSPISPIIIDRV